MNAPWSTARTFDALLHADFERVYEEGKDEVLRDHAFRNLLKSADTVEKLEKLAFGGERGLGGWTTKELFEITNLFRLLSSPENEIRLYEECPDEDFRHAPRVREYYVLALNKAGRPVEAIQEGSRIIAEGGHNALVWATLGESYSARMLFAERLAQILAEASGDLAAIDTRLITQVSHYFTEVDPADLTVALARSLQQNNLRMAIRIFRRGFRESGSSFPGLGWMLHTMDYWTELVVECGRLLQKDGTSGLDGDESLRLRLVNDEIKALEKEWDSQAILIGIALELQGGSESLDYWTHAGRLLLMVIRGDGPSAIHDVLTRLFNVADADFKLAITANELRRIRDNYAVMRQAEGTGEADTVELDLRIGGAELAIAELEASRARFQGTGKARGSALGDGSRKSPPAGPVDAVNAFLDKTINFRAMTGNLVPLYISGAIGRVGARVPDLVINRKVQEDLADLVETKILQPLTPEDRENPRAVITRIQQVIGAGFKIGDLQDLQSPAHFDFDVRSDGLIVLSGVDYKMRRNTRTATDLTAPLLMQNGDCRETMYLNGALFSCWQQIEVKKRIAKAMLCLELDFHEGFQNVVREEIPALMRYQLRGGHVSIYVDSITMCRKYQCERVSAEDGAAILRPYGIDEMRAGLPLTLYEIENSKIEVMYTDGTTAWIEPREPVTGKWRPIDHTPVPGGGVPIIAGAGANLEKIRSIRLLNLVEEHSLTFLHDAKRQTMEFCDGFYNEALFNSPYAFGSGPVNIEESHTHAGLIRAGSRMAVQREGSRHQQPVYLEFLPFSQTSYEAALVEGDIPGTIQLMGRIFKGDLKRERRRLEEGNSPIPALLEKVQEWQLGRHESATADQKMTD
jgi:hypothetical protein